MTKSELRVLVSKMAGEFGEGRMGLPAFQQGVMDLVSAYAGEVSIEALNVVGKRGGWSVDNDGRGVVKFSFDASEGNVLALMQMTECQLVNLQLELRPETAEEDGAQGDLLEGTGEEVTTKGTKGTKGTKEEGSN